MRAPVVRLKIRVRLPDGSRPYLDPVFSGNNRPRQGCGLLDGTPTHFADSVYHLRYLNGSRRIWEAVGSDAQVALISKVKRERKLEAKAAGLTVVDDEPEAAHGTTCAMPLTTICSKSKRTRSGRPPPHIHSPSICSKIFAPRSLLKTLSERTFWHSCPCCERRMPHAQLRTTPRPEAFLHLPWA